SVQLAKERQVVVVGGNKDMPAIKRGRAKVRMPIERILADVDVVTIATSVGQRLGPRVAHRQLKVTLALGGIQLHTVVIGVCVRQAIKNLRVTFVRTQSIGVYVCTTIGREVSSQRGE